MKPTPHEALRLHEEELEGYERLGDVRARAVTLGLAALGGSYADEARPSAPQELEADPEVRRIYLGDKFTLAT